MRNLGLRVVQVVVALRRVLVLGEDKWSYIEW
jgi:hypothetical protein